MESKWVDLSLNSFADIENNLFEAEGYNNSFRFTKAKQANDNIESQIQLTTKISKAIRQALSDLGRDKNKNSGRGSCLRYVWRTSKRSHYPDPDSLWQCTSLKLKSKLEIFNLKVFTICPPWILQVDPVEAAEILDTAENHVGGLNINCWASARNCHCSSQAKTSRSIRGFWKGGYRKAFGIWHTTSLKQTWSRFQQLHASLKNSMANVSALELDNAIYEKWAKLRGNRCIVITSFTWNESEKSWRKLVEQLPGYLKHAKRNNNSNFAAEVERHGKTFVLNEAFSQQLKELEAELSSKENVQDEMPWKVHPETQKSLFYHEEELEAIEDLLEKGNRRWANQQVIPFKIEKDDVNARQKVNICTNRLHAIKRYMDKRNLPGILKNSWNYSSQQATIQRALMDELKGIKSTSNQPIVC